LFGGFEILIMMILCQITCENLPKNI